MREQPARAFRAQVVCDFLDAVDAVAEPERRDAPDGGFDVRAAVRVEGDSLRLGMLIDDPVRRDTVVRRIDPAAPAGAMAWEALHYGPAFVRVFHLLQSLPDGRRPAPAPGRLPRVRPRLLRPARRLRADSHRLVSVSPENADAPGRQPEATARIRWMDPRKGLEWLDLILAPPGRRGDPTRKDSASSTTTPKRTPDFRTTPRRGRWNG
ncbi:hypothetical protein [Paludisphaera sp.]|uniref:hypothetical protein n=1 Tax=Paludisphaera sp. TaxID=2017432 RepID=UPI00301C1541